GGDRVVHAQAARCRSSQDHRQDRRGVRRAVRRAGRWQPRGHRARVRRPALPRPGRSGRARRRAGSRAGRARAALRHLRPDREKAARAARRQSAPARQEKEVIREIFGDGGVLARALPGYEPRPQQLAMAQAVLAALREQRPTVVEAGTGTGKTIAYLVPAILSGLKIIISTGTKTLQEQIYCKDIPLLQKMLPVPFTAAYMKGITNYLCRRRFKEAGVTDARIVEWAARTETGDRAELADLPEDAPIWEQIQSTPETRLGLRCMLFEDCFVTRMRRRAQQANLVIVNHHLFFADLALRATWPQAQVLPTYEAAIFDEAHGLEEVATEYFGVQVSSYRLQTLARDLAHREPAQAQLAHRIAAAAQALFDRVGRGVGPEARGRVPAELWHGETLAAYHTLDNVLDQAAAHFGQYPDDVAVALGTRAQLIRNELALLAEQK